MRKTKGKRITEDKFDAIKTALRFGKPKSVAQLFDCHYNTVTTISRFNTFQEYKDYRDATIARSRAKKLNGNNTETQAVQVKPNMEDLNRPITLKDLIETEARLEHFINKRINLVRANTATEEIEEQEQPEDSKAGFHLFSRKR